MHRGSLAEDLYAGTFLEAEPMASHLSAFYVALSDNNYYIIVSRLLSERRGEAREDSRNGTRGHRGR